MRATRFVCLGAMVGFLLWANDRAQEGIQAFKEGRYSVALEKLKRADDSTSKAFLALTQAALGNCNSALSGLLAVPQAEHETYRLARIAAVRCYSSGNEPSKAFALVDELAKQYPNDADVLYLSAKLHMKAFNDATF